MCEYCQHVYTGNGYNDLLEIPINISIGNAFKNDEDSAHDAFYVSVDGEKLVVDISIAGGDIKRAAELPIKYCPVCGQDLAYLKENGK